MPDLVADYLIERAAVRMADARIGGLLGREAGEVTRGALSVDVLAVFKRAIQAGNHRDVLPVRLQRLHSRRPFEIIDTRFVLEPPLLFCLIRVKAADESRYCSLIFTRKKLPAHNPVGDVHDHQFLVWFFAFLGSCCASLGKGMQERQQHCAAARLEKFTS